MATWVFFLRLTMLPDVLVILILLSSTLVMEGAKKGLDWRRFGSTRISSAPAMLKGRGRLMVSPGCTSVRLETETRLCFDRWSSWSTVLGVVGTVRLSPIVTFFFAMLIVTSFSMMKLVPAKKSVTRPATTKAEKWRTVVPRVK